MSEPDLSLIRAFVAVYETGSVSAAARRLHVTQPSVSHSLARLKDLLHQPLFTRTRQGMVPTALANELYPDMQSALDVIATVFARAIAFDPAQTKRVFTIAMTDLGEIAFLPAIMRMLSALAPAAQLQVVSVQMELVADWLLKGRIDAALCPTTSQLAGLKSALVFDENYCCIYRSGHPRMTQDANLDAYLAETHISVAGSAGHDIVESAWTVLGIEPKVALRLPSLGVVESIVAASDYLAVVPSRIATAFSRRDSIAVAPLPYPVPSFEVRLHWWDHDRASEEGLWFRGVVIEALAALA